MKKFLFAITALIAASSCNNNAPQVSESVGKVQEMKDWVDSIKAIVDTCSNFDSVTWSNIDAQFQDAVAGINEQELDEATRTTYSAIRESFNGVMATAHKGIEMSKVKALELQNKVDSSATQGNNMIEEIKETADHVMETGKNVKEGLKK